jgi:hypothetical protein
LTTAAPSIAARPRGVRLRRALRSTGSFVLVILLTYLGLLAVTFVIGRVIPIDPVLAIVGDHAPEHVVARVREEMGLNKPLWQQFWIYLTKVVQGDFGTSVLTTNPVMEDILKTFPSHTGTGNAWHHHRRGAGRAAGCLGRGAPRWRGGPGGAGHGPDRLFGADFLAGSDGPGAVLRQAGLGGRAGAHRCLI